MPAEDRSEIIDVLREVRALLALPDNDFSWSSWVDAEHALREVDGLIAGLEAGRRPPRLTGSVLFAPTGPIQEVSLSSGWADEFLAVASRWDAAIAKASACGCTSPPIDPRGFERRALGVDEGRGRFADVSIDQCSRCGREWLHYQYEVEAIPESGRWYRGLVTPGHAARATAANALDILAALPWHLYGGSYFGTSGRRSGVPLDPALA